MVSSNKFKPAIDREALHKKLQKEIRQNKIKVVKQELGDPPKAPKNLKPPVANIEKEITSDILNFGSTLENLVALVPSGVALKDVTVLLKTSSYGSPQGTYLKFKQIVADSEFTSKYAKYLKKRDAFEEELLDFQKKKKNIG